MTPIIPQLLATSLGLHLLTASVLAQQQQEYAQTTLPPIPIETPNPNPDQIVVCAPLENQQEQEQENQSDNDITQPTLLNNSLCSTYAALTSFSSLPSNEIFTGILTASETRFTTAAAATTTMMPDTNTTTPTGTATRTKESGSKASATEGGNSGQQQGSGAQRQLGNFSAMMVWERVLVAVLLGGVVAGGMVGL